MATANEDMKSVRYNGKDYATLDFTAPGTTAIGTQQGFLEVPEGWTVAQKSEGVLAEVVAKFLWGAKFVARGIKYHTTQEQKKGSMYKAYLEDRRVLICTDAPAGSAAVGDHCAQALARMWQSPDFADCEVVCNGHVFRCHRIVLAQASPVFKQMLSGEMSEAKSQRIQLEGLETETEAAAAFLEFMYTGVLDCKSEHFPTVVKLADFYQLDITTKTCNVMLQAVDSGNVVPTARLFKSKREKHRFKPYWVKLAHKMQKTEELALAVLSEV